jgi:hypothetical protein
MDLSLNKYDNMCIKVYDPSNQKLIAVYTTFQKTANKLGLTYKIVHVKATSKKRVYAPLLDLEVAIRISVKKEGDDKLISQTQLKGIL